MFYPNNYEVVRVDTIHAPFLKNFLLRYEYYSVPLMEAFLQFFPQVDFYAITTKESNKIEGVFAIIKTVFFHNFPFMLNGTVSNLLALEKKIMAVIKNQKINQIIGEKHATDFLYKIVNKKAVQKRGFIFMILNVQNVYQQKHQELQNRIQSKIRQCFLSDFDVLLPLVCDYYFEEVEPDAEKNFDLRLKIWLKNRLKTQIIFSMIIDTVPISLAGTSAIGLHWAQLAWVYTHRNYRNRGFSYNTTGRIISFLQAKNLKVALFVRPKNYAALALYQKLGFIPYGEFSIYTF